MIRFAGALTVAFAICGTPVMAYAEPYLCKDFAVDFDDIGKNPDVADSKPVAFQRAAGFLLGSYYAFTGKPFSGSDTTGMAQFERQVAAACKERPEERTSEVALEIVRKNQRSIPPSSSFSPDDQVALSESMIEYDDGFARLIFRVENKKSEIIGVSVRCGLYDKNDTALGQGGGIVNGIPPGQTVVGEGLAQVPRAPVRADCRVVRVSSQ